MNVINTTKELQLDFNTYREVAKELIEGLSVTIAERQSDIVRLERALGEDKLHLWYELKNAQAKIAEQQVEIARVTEVLHKSLKMAAEKENKIAGGWGNDQHR